MTSNISQNHIVHSHDTISVAAKQFHITLNRPMMGDEVSQEVLTAHPCQTMTHFELGCVKNFGS
jgi:hypothetical protein